MAYADFVTAMMALFLVLWLVSQDEDVKEAVERAFRNPSAHKAMVSKSSGLLTDQKEGHRHSRKERGRFNSSAATELKLLRRMHEDLMDVLKNDDGVDEPFRLNLSPDELKIDIYDLPSAPLFESGKSTFTDHGMWVLSTMAWYVANRKGLEVELQGHTKAVGHETPVEDPWVLSFKRANETRKLMATNGVDAKRMPKVSGCANLNPLVNEPAESELNERVSIILRLSDKQN